MRFRAPVAVATAILLTAAAGQATASGWKRVTAPGGASTDQVSPLRTPDGTLHLAWRIQTGGTTEDIRHTRITRGGALGATTRIVSGWASVQSPALVAVPGGIRAFFGGIRTTEPGETLVELASAFSGDGGATWGPPEGPIVPGGAQAYGSPVSAATLPDGTTLQSWAGTLGTWVHAGLDPASPNRDLQAPLGQYGYDTGMAAAGDGSAMVAWYSSAEGNLGVFAQAVGADGAPLGAAMNMPGTAAMRIGMIGRTPLVARPGGGYYVAYATGYPALSSVRLWRVGAGASRVIARTGRLGNSTATLAAAADGRLWVVWTQPRAGAPRVLARRSNLAATVFGAVVSAGRPAGASNAYRLDASDAGGALDVLGMFGIGASPSTSTYHTRVLPGLSLSASTRGASRSRPTAVRFTVRDAGDPVRGARVAAGGRSARTDARGRAVLRIPAGARRVTAVATATGYTRASLALPRTA